jgi:hypothetical protein
MKRGPTGAEEDGEAVFDALSEGLDLPANPHPAAVKVSALLRRSARAELVGIAQPIACGGKVGRPRRRDRASRRRARPWLIAMPTQCNANPVAGMPCRA